MEGPPVCIDRRLRLDFTSMVVQGVRWPCLVCMGSDVVLFLRAWTEFCLLETMDKTRQVCASAEIWKPSRAGFSEIGIQWRRRFLRLHNTTLGPTQCSVHSFRCGAATC